MVLPTESDVVQAYCEGQQDPASSAPEADEVIAIVANLYRFHQCYSDGTKRLQDDISLLERQAQVKAPEKATCNS